MGLFDGLKKAREKNFQKTNIFNKAIAGVYVSEEEKSTYKEITGKELDVKIKEVVEKHEKEEELKKELEEKKQKIAELKIKIENSEELTPEEIEYFNNKSGTTVERYKDQDNSKKQIRNFKETHSVDKIQFDSNNKTIKIKSRYYHYADLVGFKTLEGRDGQYVSFVHLELYFKKPAGKTETIKLLTTRVKRKDSLYKRTSNQVATATLYLNEAYMQSTEDDTKEEDLAQPNHNLDDIKKLKELLDQKLITQEEYDAKKKQILGL